jgi:hypothetical protein
MSADAPMLAQNLVNKPVFLPLWLFEDRDLQLVIYKSLFSGNIAAIDLGLDPVKSHEDTVTR